MLLYERLKDRRIILASNSPRRRQLLADAGIGFELAQKYECDEVLPADIAAGDAASYIAELKSNAYPWPLTERDILITADTVVIVGNEILGKPADREDALRMLGLLSGRTHTVVTGVMFRTPAGSHSFKAETSVTFRPLSDEELAYYVDNFRPYDKAGAYGIQEWIGYAAVERIEGSFYNVMGLPVQRLYTELEAFIGANR